MEQLDRARARLRNIRSVQPILGALRTISLGYRAQALNRQRYLQAFQRELAAVLDLASGTGLQRRGTCVRLISSPAPTAGRVVTVLVVGSQRGFCGAFNESLAAFATERIESLLAEGNTVHILLRGARLTKAMPPKLLDMSQPAELPGASLPSLDSCQALVHAWLGSYESHQLDAVDIIAHSYRGMAQYGPAMTRVLPPPIAPLTAVVPPYAPIVETEPLELVQRALGVWIATSVYRLLLDSAVAEHSVRFQLMDGAAQNAGKMVEDLQLYVQMARQQAITIELQDLVGGAGMLGPLAE